MPDRPLSADVTVSFNEGADDDINLVLELSVDAMPGLNPFIGWHAVREFPVTGGVTRQASVGLIQDLGIVNQLTRNEFIQFDGEEGSVKYPVDSATITTEVLFAFTPTGQIMSPSQLHFTFTHHKTSIKANRPFIGAIRVQYFASYRVLGYLPDGGGIQTGYTLGDGFLRKFGTIISVKNTSSALLDIEPSDINDDTRRELYRVTSETQSNVDGTWEKHPDYLTGGFWPITGSPRLGDPLMGHERPHEIGYLLRDGGIRYDIRTVPYEQGTTSSPNFYPVLTCRIQTAAQYAGTLWEDVFASVDIANLKDEIEKHWPSPPWSLTFV